MRLVLLVTIASVLCDAAPQLKIKDTGAYILEQHSDLTNDKSWNWRFNTSNGISRDEKGTVGGDGSVSVTGRYSWRAPNGVTYHVRYMADKGGYRADVTKKRPMGNPFLRFCDATLASLCG